MESTTTRGRSSSGPRETPAGTSGGCLTGPNHSGVELHGFLSYLVRCNLEGREYTVFGYKGKQVRDNIHSLDVARFIEAFIAAPRIAEVYNLGGGKGNSCSILEAFSSVEGITGRPQRHRYVDSNRSGDHICFYSDLAKMRRLGVRLVHGDVRAPEDLESLPPVDWVIDAAANPSVLAGVDGLASSRQVVAHNLGGTLNLLELSRRHGAGFLLVSSSRVYSIAALAGLPVEERRGAFRLAAGRAATPGVSDAGLAEDFPTTPPISLYGASKLAERIPTLRPQFTTRGPMATAGRSSMDSTTSEATPS